MASRLTSLANAASAYIKRRSSSVSASGDPSDETRSPAGLLGRLAGLFSRRQAYPQNRTPTPPGEWMESTPGAPPRVGPPGRWMESSPGAPPRSGPPGPWMETQQGAPPLPPPPPITGNAPTDDDYGDEQEEFDDITILGRSKAYDHDDWAEVAQRMRLVNSSNVYGYYYQPESPTSGILYVQYLDYTPKSLGGSGDRGGPGPTYAYFGIPAVKYRQFEAMAESSAGGAVWDYCRVRGSKFEHQHQYQLIQVSGEYVPRKTTAMGFKRRNVANIGIGRRNQALNRGGAARRQLGEYTHVQQDGTQGWPRVNRGTPNRGGPNRGR